MNESENPLIERFVKLETKFDAFATMVKAYMEKEELIFFGNGHEGLLFEHKRLMAAFGWWRWISGGALILLAAAFAAHYIKLPLIG